MTWWEASVVAKAGARVRRRAWRDRWIAWERALFHRVPVDPVTLAEGRPRVVKASDWSPTEFLAQDWTVEPIPPAEGELADVTLALIRYRWTDGDGVDLDTRTAIVGAGAVPPDGIEVGYARPGNVLDDSRRVGPDGSLVADDTWWLFWGGDITAETGREILAARLDRLAAVFPDTPFEIRLRAHWFATRLSGDVTIEVEAFTGGSLGIDPDTGDFTCDGDPAGTLAIPLNVTAGNDGVNVGEDLGSLVYAPSTRSLTFQPA